MHGHWLPGPKPQTHAAAARRRKQRQLEAQLTELGMEALDERLQMATQARLGLLSPRRIAPRRARSALNPSHPPSKQRIGTT